MKSISVPDLTYSPLTLTSDTDVLVLNGVIITPTPIYLVRTEDCLDEGVRNTVIADAARYMSSTAKHMTAIIQSECSSSVIMINLLFTNNNFSIVDVNSLRIGNDNACEFVVTREMIQLSQLTIH